MTPKPPRRGKGKPRPVVGWAILSADGTIYAGKPSSDAIAWSAQPVLVPGEKLVRVRVVPVPPRKVKR